MKGKIYLVGAGPGDADLLTVKAEKLIRSADVIVFDEDIETTILEMIKPSAKLVDISEIVGSHSASVDNVHQILLGLAEEYETIIRLKCGDPFVFSLGVNEVEKLSQSGVPFEVVPGLSSATAVPAYAGIPVTYANRESSLHIMSGKDASLIDYKSLVSIGGTIVFMMAIQNAGEISSGLIASGMDKSTPCAVIEHGSRSKQRKFISTIENLENMVSKNQVKSLSLVVIGEVVNCSEPFDWFSNKPLKNIKILATQKAKNSSRLVPRLKELGADIIFCPATQAITTLPQSFNMDKYSVIAFTSSYGVDSFFQCLSAQNKDARSLNGKKIACIGSQTAKTTLAHGIKADFVPEVFCGKSMAEGMIETGMLTHEDNLLLIRPTDATEEILSVLNKNKINYDNIPFYKTEYLSQKHISDITEFDYITFTAKSGVESFVNSQSHLDFSLATAICIGDQTKETAIEYGFNVVSAKEGTVNSMIDKIVELSKEKNN